MRILSTSGPYNGYLSDKIYADTTLASLRSSVPPDPLTNKPGCATSECWPDVSNQPGLLYIAAQLWFLCTRPQEISAELTSGNTLTIKVSDAGQCPPGAESAAIPLLCLLGVPLSALPHGSLRIANLWEGSATPIATVHLP